jgi:predicted TPR repeat methyltransferase
VLDVGCGMGFALLTMKHLGFTSLTGVEVDAGQVASCQAKGLNVEQAPDTISWLRDRPASADLILCLDVLEHVPVLQQIDFARAIRSALSDSGLLICTVPNANSALAARWRYNDWTHSSSFTEHSLDLVLWNGGFKQIDIQPVEFNTRPKRVWLPVGGARHWWAFKFFRLIRRLQLMAELGPGQGRVVPLSLNILATARP